MGKKVLSGLWDGVSIPIDNVKALEKEIGTYDAKTLIDEISENPGYFISYQTPADRAKAVILVAKEGPPIIGILYTTPSQEILASVLHEMLHIKYPYVGLSAKDPFFSRTRFAGLFDTSDAGYIEYHDLLEEEAQRLAREHPELREYAIAKSRGIQRLSEYLAKEVLPKDATEAERLKNLKIWLKQYNPNVRI